MPTPPQDLNQFNSLVQIVADLRGPQGCPWDKEQTHQSLTRYAIEECYEFIDAVNEKNYADMKDELGDILLQVLLHSQIAKENNHFEVYDVIQAINEKMVRRHPHVFANTKVNGTDEVWENWEEIKRKEKINKPKKIGFDIPKHLSPLLKSLKIGEKVKKKNFDWPNIDGVIDKVDEELNETKEAISTGNNDDILHEVGDLLFSVCQLARHLNLDPEQALQLANLRFEKRFIQMEKEISSDNKQLEKLSTEEMETYWNSVKRKSNNNPTK